MYVMGIEKHVMGSEIYVMGSEIYVMGSKIYVMGSKTSQVARCVSLAGRKVESLHSGGGSHRILVSGPEQDRTVSRGQAGQLQTSRLGLQPACSTIHNMSAPLMACQHHPQRVSNTHDVCHVCYSSGWTSQICDVGCT
jgi:hypothetical protein